MRRLVALGMVLMAAPFGIAAGGEQKPATIPDLIHQLSSNDFHARQYAARQLGNLGLAARDAVPALGKALHDNFPEVRGSAGKALGQIGTPAVAELVKALKDRDAGIRTRAVQALGQAGPDAKEAVPALIEALKDTHVDVRVAAVDALGEMGAEGKEAASPLTRLFHDSSGRVREHVPAALGQIGTAAIGPLCDALGDEKIEVRLDAIKTIMLFGAQAKKAVPTLRQAMKDEDARIRAAAAEALGKMELDAEEAVPELLAALKDKNRKVHNKAANAVVLMTMAGVPNLLEKVRKAENKEAWLAPMLQANLAIKAANPLTPLLKDLTDKDPQVRSKAALTLGSLGPQAQPAVRALTKALGDDNVQVRLSAAMAIARIERTKVEVNLAVKRVLREVKDQLDDMKALQALAKAAADVGRVNPVAAASPDPTRPNPAQVEQFLMTYIAFKVTMRAHGGWPMMAALEQRLELYFNLLQEEAVPALVAGINFVARNNLGDC
ncbi:MAG TPA: HEAT repeat domain-containing protein [Gemmataceae bacterium]|jgi:HEAT repeat protein